MKRLFLLMTAVLMCFAFAGCAGQKKADYSSYEGKTYEGTTPWGGQTSVTVNTVSDGKMEWTYLESVNNAGWEYNLQVTSDLENGKGDFKVEAEDQGQQAEYTGTIELKDGNVVLTYDDGQKTELSDSGDGGNGYEMVGALDDDQKTVVLKEAK